MFAVWSKRAESPVLNMYAMFAAAEIAHVPSRSSKRDGKASGRYDEDGDTTIASHCASKSRI